MIKLWKNDEEYDLVNEDEIEELTQPMGDIQHIYDRCGNSFTGFICSLCLVKKNLKGCGQMKVVRSIKSTPDKIEVVFKDGSIMFYEAWEKIDEI